MGRNSVWLRKPVDSLFPTGWRREGNGASAFKYGDTDFEKEGPAAQTSGLPSADPDWVQNELQSVRSFVKV